MKLPGYADQKEGDHSFLDDFPLYYELDKRGKDHVNYFRRSLGYLIEEAIEQLIEDIRSGKIIRARFGINLGKR